MLSPYLSKSGLRERDARPAKEQMRLGHSLVQTKHLVKKLIRRMQLGTTRLILYTYVKYSWYSVDMGVGLAVHRKQSGNLVQKAFLVPFSPD